MKFWGVGVCAMLLVLGCGCSGDNVAGNSAETGSPELAGLFVLDDGAPASFARIRVVKSGLPYENTVPFAEILADSIGKFTMDSVPDGMFSLEAYHSESGKRLLVQNMTDENTSMNDTLRSPGTVVFDVETLADEIPDGTAALASIGGTLIERNSIVDHGRVFIDSLPMGEMDIRVRLLSRTPVDKTFDGVDVASDDTVEVKFDTLVVSFVAPLSSPGIVVDESNSFTDFPLLLRLDSSICNLDEINSLTGRWEVYRIKPDGSRLESLPIMKNTFDSRDEALFWVRLDSLNTEDSVELVFNTSKSPRYAGDVFPTNRLYAAVWTFEDESSVVEDLSEKRYFPGTLKNGRFIDGVIGKAVALKDGAAVVAEKSASSDTSKAIDFNLAFDHSFYFSMWIKLDDATKAQRILGKGESQYELVYIPDSGFVMTLYHEADTTDLSALMADTSKALDSAALAKRKSSYKFSFASGKPAFDLSEWNYLAIEYHGNMGVAFMALNDSVAELPRIETPWSGSRDESADFVLGGFSGAVDEFVFSGMFFPEEFLRLGYFNQRSKGWPVLKARE